MTKDDPIKMLMEQGLSSSEAVKEFYHIVNYFLMGTGRTESDRRYAEECAIESIKESLEESFED